MTSLRTGMKRRQWIIIIVVALAVALVTLLWIDVRGAGDPQLCGVGYDGSGASIAK